MRSNFNNEKLTNFLNYNQFHVDEIKTLTIENQPILYSVISFINKVKLQHRQMEQPFFYKII